MKVVLSFPQTDGQTGVAIQDAFVELGHDVMVVDANVAPHTLADVCRAIQPRLVFCSRTIPLTAQIRCIKNTMPDVVTCVWCPDVRENLSEWNAWLPLFSEVNYLFTVAESAAERFREHVNPNSFWLPQGVQTSLYHPPNAISSDDVDKYACDISFAGGVEGGEKIHGWRTKFHDALNRIKGVKVKYFGCYGQPKITGEEHNKLAVLSKINLGMSMALPWASKYQSVRDYKVLAAGGFLLTKYSARMEEWFPCFGPNAQVDCLGLAIYRDENDMIDAVKFWLDSDEDRKWMAANGKAWVDNGHTYTDRIRSSLERMQLG